MRIKEKAMTEKTKTTPALLVNFSDNEKEQLRQVADATGMTMNALVREAVALHADQLLGLEKFAMVHPHLGPIFQLYYANSTIYYRCGEKLPEDIQAAYTAFMAAFGDWIAQQLTRELKAAQAAFEN